jgi:superfamily II DNA/RNA helicase
MSFADLGASASVAQALVKEGIGSPFPIQALVIPDALAGRDVLAKSQTGSGKTLAFAVPLVERIDPKSDGPVALVLVPTRELAMQVAEEFRWLGAVKGIRTTAVYGGVPLAKQAASARKAHVVVATPGRLDDLEGRNMLSLKKINTLVLDEADRMLDMGFQPQVDRIVRRLPSPRHTLLFSATLDGPVLRMASSYTKDPVSHEVAVDENEIRQADHRFVPVSEGDKLDALIEVLNEDSDGLALVFVRTKRGADRLRTRLRGKGIQALALHGDMTQAARNKTLARFTEGNPRVLVATDVAARGIHLDDITHVVNYDAPMDLDSYVHRTGRTARAGRSGIAVTLVSALQQRDVGLMASRLDLKTEFEASGLTTPKPATVYSSRPRGRRRR